MEWQSSIHILSHNIICMCFHVYTNIFFADAEDGEEGYSVVTVAASTTTIVFLLLLCVVVFSLTIPVCIKRKGRNRSQRVALDTDTLQSTSSTTHMLPGGVTRHVR